MKGDNGAASTACKLVWGDNKLTYFKLSGDVWAVNTAGIPGQCQALPKYKQVQYSTFHVFE